jgi:hypothetical protein
MKHTFTCIAAVVILAGCSSTKTTVNPDEPIRNQKLSTNFTEDNVKIETNCAWYKPWKSDCDITAIEATATAWTNGASTVQVNEGRKVARSQAMANVSHFINTQVTSSRVTNTIAKHVEKAKDQMQSGGGDSEMTDKEAKATNIAVRENSNDTARTVTSTIRENSEAILKGFRTVKEEKVGQQEVAVTIRWDHESEKAANELRKRMGQ